MLELTLDEQALLTKLCGKKLSTLTRTHLENKAYARGKRKQWREAFVLSMAAARVAKRDGTDEAPISYVRAAQALAELGDEVRAIELLEAAVEGDWRTSDALRRNENILHAGYVTLVVLLFRRAPARAREVFWQANTTFAARGGFPWVYPAQEALAERLAGARGWARERAHVAKMIESS